MNRTSFYTAWAGMFILCAGLGFIPEPAGFLKFLLILLTLGFFAVPGWFLVWLDRRGDTMNIALVRNLALASLSLTLALILVNVVSFMAPEWVGNLLHILLIVVSAPMACGRYWVLSLFLWACLMIWAQKLLKKK
jgi:hypothetical protein